MLSPIDIRELRVGQLVTDDTGDVSVEGITETEAAGIQNFCAATRYCMHARKRATFLQGDFTARQPRTTRSKISDPQCPSPYSATLL